MNLKSRLAALGSYAFVGALALGLALWAASALLKPGQAQLPDPFTGEVTPSPAAPPPPGQDAATPESADAPLPSEPAPAVIPQDVSFLEPYVYDLREGRRNPFKPPPTIDGTEVESGSFPGLELERFELDEIKLVAIMWDIKNPKAMFMDPNGQVHTLGKDDRIGRKRGYIAQIREGEVVVVETSSFSGEAVYSTRILRIER